MTKIIGICMFVIGGILLLLSSYGLIINMTTSREEMVEQLKMEINKYGNSDFISEEEIERIVDNNISNSKIIDPILIVVGGSITYGGFAFYRQHKKRTPLAKDSDFRKLIKRQNKLFILTFITFVVLFFVSLYFLSFVENPLFYLILLLWIFGIVYIVREAIFFNFNFGDVGRHLVSWEYPNGDKLIVTCWGLMKKNSNNPKFSASVKFKGFKWGFDNAKDLTESLIKHEGNPLIALLPSIEFSAKTNRIDDYIPFSFVDNIHLTFVEKDKGYLIIEIEKKNYNSQYTLTYPLPLSKSSLESEVNIFEERIKNKRTPVRGVYLEKSYIEQVLKEKQ